MATKAQIKSKMQSVYTGNPDVTDWAEVEETLHTESESILENIYPSEILDTETTTNVFTKASGSSYTYELRTVKQGRVVHVTGQLTNNSNTYILALVVASITSTEHMTNSTSVYRFNINTSTNESMRGFVSNNILRLIGVMGIGETLNLDFKYYTEN